MLKAKHQLLLLEESEQGQASAAAVELSKFPELSMWPWPVRRRRRRCGRHAMTPQFSSSAGWRAGSLSLRRVAGRIIV